MNRTTAACHASVETHLVNAGGDGPSRRQFVLVCYHDDGLKLSAEWTYWVSRQEAEQARDQLTPCGPHCIGVHSIASVSAGILTETIPPAASGKSAPPRRRSAPSVDNVNKHSPIHREEGCAS